MFTKIIIKTEEKCTKPGKTQVHFHVLIMVKYIYFSDTVHLYT